MYIFNSFYLLHSYDPSFLSHQYLKKTSLSIVFICLCFNMVSFRGLIQNFRRASVPPSYAESPPPPGTKRKNLLFLGLSQQQISSGLPILPRYRAVRSHEIAAYAPTQCKAYAILVEARFCCKDKNSANFFTMQECSPSSTPPSAVRGKEKPAKEEQGTNDCTAWSQVSAIS